MAMDRGKKKQPLVPFEYVAGNPEAWQEVAHDLLGSANIILDALRDRRQFKGPTVSRGPSFWRTLMMLYGLAAENLIKAIIVAKKPDGEVSFPVSKGSLPGWFANHSLPELAKVAGLSVSASQRHLLKRLKEFVECGKYPVGRREGQGPSTWFFSESVDSDDALQLLEYLEEELQRASGGHVAAHPDLRGIHRERP